MNFKGKLGQYREVITNDGSMTLWSEAFDEECHSLSGAASETLYNFVKANGIITHAHQHREVRVLEVGFGTGLGYQLLAQEFQNQHVNCQLHFHSLEIDPKLVEWAKERPYAHLKNFGNIKDLALEHNQYVTEQDGSTLTVSIGDAVETLPTLYNDFHFIFQDAFSPKKNPELWTKKWFETLYDKASPQATLTTYCSAVQARRSMREAGWRVESIPGYARKREATRAFK